jgi:hypothetical protein
VDGRIKRSVFGVWQSALSQVGIWSIAVYEGPTPFQLAPRPGSSVPALRARHVTDVAACFVADPFLAQDGSRWVMFMEVGNLATRKGEIGVATSADGVSWCYERIVLAEPFHLSYPYVFRWQGEWYMVPESYEAGAVRLYRAVEFPYRWAFERQLLDQPYLDSSVVHHGGRWWMFTADLSDVLHLYHAAALEQSWHEHPASPIVVGDRSISRPGGRILCYEGRLYRFAQDGLPRYGSRLHAFEITKLTEQEYEECPVPGNPLLAASGFGWNSAGMHHVDLHQLADGRWIAAVDGHRFVRRVHTLGLRIQAAARSLAAAVIRRSTKSSAGDPPRTWSGTAPRGV